MSALLADPNFLVALAGVAGVLLPYLRTKYPNLPLLNILPLPSSPAPAPVPVPAPAEPPLAKVDGFSDKAIAQLKEALKP